MKLSEILEMEAGPELNKLVAEKVMNWRIHSRNTAFWVKAEDEHEVLADIQFEDDWNPSFYISHAFNALDKSGRRYILRNVGNHYLVSIDCLTDQRMVCATGKTMPLAICFGLLHATLKERGELEE